MWAYEYEAGKFIAGEILNDTLYMYAPTGRGEKWVMNSEGVVLEYSSEPFHKSDEIIAGINAHYGTSFYQEDDIDKDFTVGETMPDWSAYEKILIQLKDGYYKYDFSGGAGQVYTAMIVQNGNVELYASSLESGSNICVYGPEGNFIAANASENLIPLIQEICSKYPNFVSVSRYVKDNSNLENWSEYTLLS